MRYLLTDWKIYNFFYILFFGHLKFLGDLGYFGDLIFSNYQANELTKNH